MDMTTTIRVSDETKDRLERLKREGESFDDLLKHLIRIEATAGILDRPEDEGLSESVSQTHEELTQSLEDRTDEPGQ